MNYISMCIIIILNKKKVFPKNKYLIYLEVFKY